MVEWTSHQRAEQTARWLATGRVAFGVAACALPQLTGNMWIGSPRGRAAGTAVLMRALGARDMALGLGALLAIRRGAPVSGWLEAGTLADLGDALTTLASFSSLPRRTRWPVLASALGSAVAGSVVARSLSATSQSGPMSARSAAGA